MPRARSDVKVNPGSHWYPSADQLKDPAATHRALKQVLDQFYALQDRHDALAASHAELQKRTATAQSGPPPGSGPTDSMICGLRIAPIDTNSLANGAALKYNSASGNFSFQ